MGERDAVVRAAWAFPVALGRRWDIGEACTEHAHGEHKMRTG
ncbi:hypothetical protein [Streptomyces sp. MNU76]|nr:hypothetical protein [Streptomyces sp. MNU76]